MLLTFFLFNDELCCVSVGPQNVSIEGKSPAFAGQKVTLSCFAFSVPPAIFTWRFNGNETDVNHTMYIIDKIEDTYTGNYTCTASNYVTGLNDSAILSLTGEWTANKIFVRMLTKCIGIHRVVFNLHL